MIKSLQRFIKNENGAVTVDWVVLTAGTVGLCIGAATIIETQAVDLSADVAATIENENVLGTTASTGTAGGD
jgi:Flp pilus assembly pilin Flp